MCQSRSRTAYVSAVIYLMLTLLIGISIVLLPLNGIECDFALNLQILAQKTIGLQAFQILTYLGDFYLWVVIASIYFVFAYFKSRKRLGSAIELAIFLIITTALTYSLKMVFARPRPDCSGLGIYDGDFVSSFSYPSGHASRAVGAFLILSRGSKTQESLAIVAVSLVSVSRIVLGAHYLTDVVGGIFLSLAAQKLADMSMLFLKSRNERIATIIASINSQDQLRCKMITKLQAPKAKHAILMIPLQQRPMASSHVMLVG